MVQKLTTHLTNCAECLFFSSIPSVKSQHTHGLYKGNSPRGRNNSRERSSNFFCVMHICSLCGNVTDVFSVTKLVTHFYCSCFLYLKIYHGYVTNVGVNSCWIARCTEANKKGKFSAGKNSHCFFTVFSSVSFSPSYSC